MTWTYLPSELNSTENGPLYRVRFVLGDVDEQNQHISDEEIRFAIEKHDGDEHSAAIMCAEHIHTRYAQEASYSIESYRVELSRRAEVFGNIVKELRSRGSSAAPLMLKGKPSYFNRFRGHYDPAYAKRTNGYGL